MSNSRMIWLDIGKGIAIICVVLGHSILGLESPVKHAIFSFHMPLFFIYAGVTLRPKPMRDVLRASCHRLLVPYILLFAIYALFLVLHSAQLSIKLFESIGLSFIFASAIVVKPWGIPAAGMIWFLAVLFISRTVMNFVVLQFEKFKVKLVIQVVIIVLFSSVGIIVGQYYFLPFSADLVPLSCLFMFCGYLVKEKGLLNRVLSIPVVLAAFIIWFTSISFCWFSMGDRMFALAPLAILGAISGTIIISKISQFIEKHIGPLCSCLSFLGVNSMLLFALHYIESHMIDWINLPLLVSLPSPAIFYAVFVARFVFILGVIFVFMNMPIARSQKKGNP